MNIEEKQQVRKLRQEGLGYKKIANELHISINTVKSFCRTNHLTASYLPTKTYCKNCGKELSQNTHGKQKIFCSCACKQAWWNRHRNQVANSILETYTCPACQITFKAYPHENRKYCSHACYITARFKAGNRHE